MLNKTLKTSEANLTTYHLVRGMDLNHHGTLFAGKGALLFVEAGFVVTSLALETNEIVCFRIHGMLFKLPVNSGETIALESQIVYAGKSSIGVYVRVYMASNNEQVVDGFLTFVRADEETHKPVPHGLTIEVDSERVALLQEQYLVEKKQ